MIKQVIITAVAVNAVICQSGQGVTVPSISCLSFIGQYLFVLKDLGGQK